MASFDMHSTRLIITPNNNTGVTEWTPCTQKPIHIVSMHVFPVNVVLGDTVTIEFYMGETKIAEYAKDTHLSGFSVTMSFDRQDPLEIPANITIKLIYNAIDTDGRELILWTRYKKP